MNNGGFVNLPCRARKAKVWGQLENVDNIPFQDSSLSGYITPVKGTTTKTNKSKANKTQNLTSQLINYGNNSYTVLLGATRKLHTFCGHGKEIFFHGKCDNSVLETLSLRYRRDTGEDL